MTLEMYITMNPSHRGVYRTSGSITNTGIIQPALTYTFNLLIHRDVCDVSNIHRYQPFIRTI